MSTRPNKERTYLDLGSYNVTCDRCGKKIKNTRARKEWTGLIVCGRCLDERHPQDFVRARVDHMTVPVARPVPNYTFQNISPTGIYGSLLTPLPSGPENTWDSGNIVNVSLTSGTLASAPELNVLSGANLIAINGTNGWEILQYENAALVSGTTYNLTRLLRARYGTYQNMGAPSGARFVYLGQASPSVSDYIQTELGINVLYDMNISTPTPLYVQNIITVIGAGSVVTPQGVTNMKVEAIGGGGGSQTSLYYAGGGGGAYARTNKILVNPGQVIYYNVGAGGAINGNGSASWVNTITSAPPTSKATGCLADYGKTATNLTGGGGAGLAANSIGDLTVSGGQGGHATFNGGGGGGGAGGPIGPGGAGGSNLPTGGGGGGGGGANGGFAGGSTSTNNGGAGGNNNVSAGGGSAGLAGNPGGYGLAGVAGGGGGGAGAATVGNNNGGPGGSGGSDATFDATHGCGGGGGGGGAATGSGIDGTGGAGGLFGGGGAASGGWSLTGIGAVGAQGIVIITFYP